MGSQSSPEQAVLIYSDELSRHELSPTHPLKPVRYRYAYELSQGAGLLDLPNVKVAPPREATREEIETFHRPDYVDTVETIGAADRVADIGRYGFGPGDNPAYPGIYHANAMSAGSTMVATELVASGDAQVAFAIAGGLHHAMPAQASGFCVFNDPVMSIEWLLARDYRVAYVDIDCHHGDGVQHAFYDSDRVLTISIHESGRYLFPGTGDVGETGAGDGVGYSVNVPLAPYTTDEIYLEAFESVVPPLIEAFRPDAIFTQLGIDTHFLDPLTHLSLTTQGHNQVVARLGEIGRDVGKWIAAGGGGYDLGAVARAWTMDLATMAGHKLPDEIPVPAEELPSLTTFPDRDAPELDGRSSAEVRDFALQSVSRVRETVFPIVGAS
ncbi:MAG: acetoin utilization protein AcuC [Chloroflexota bacterium]